jgi:hypothetical protein
MYLVASSFAPGGPVMNPKNRTRQLAVHAAREVGAVSLCLADFGGYGACVDQPGHDGPHIDANGYEFLTSAEQAAQAAPVVASTHNPLRTHSVSALDELAIQVGEELYRCAHCDELDTIIDESVPSMMSGYDFAIRCGWCGAYETHNPFSGKPTIYVPRPDDATVAADEREARILADLGIRS